MDKKIIDCATLTAEEKEQFFGKGFVLVSVISFYVFEGVMHTTVIIDGNQIVLIGDPEKALHNYMLGVENGEKH